MDRIDRFDRKILALMQQNSRRTGQQLAEQVGLSSAACLRRLDRLRKIGAIEREVAVLSGDVSGPTTQIIVLLTVARHNPRQVDELTADLARRDEVTRLFSVTGHEDIAVILNVPSVEAFSEFANRHFRDAPVEGFQSLVVLREVAKAAA